jgi:cytoskeletal protein CcmA (bactofilin family)
MLFNNRKPEEPSTQGTVLIKDAQGAAASATPASPPRPSPNLAGPAARCVIDAGLVINGNLESERDVQLDGEVHGDIRCTQLIISRNATLLGNVVATEVVVRGTIKGNIRADLVMLQDTARVESEIFHRSLIVEEGASFDGESHRTDQDAGAVAGLSPRLGDLKAMAADMRQAAAGDDKADEKKSAAA